MTGFLGRLGMAGAAHAEPTKGEMLAEKYERRFNRATSTRNGASAFAVANDIAAKFTEAANSVAAGGDALAFLHRYDQGFKVIPYAKDTLRSEAAIAASKAIAALRQQPDARMQMMATWINRWAMGIQAGASDATAAMVNPAIQVKSQGRNPAQALNAPVKWPPQGGGKPSELRSYQQGLVEA